MSALAGVIVSALLNPCSVETISGTDIMMLIALLCGGRYLEKSSGVDGNMLFDGRICRIVVADL